MSEPSQNFYAQRRARDHTKNVLRDEQFPAERLVQAIWQHQRLRRGELKTASGTRIRVFHPGFASVEGGPDFRGAVLQIGGDAPCSGDVEVDLRASGWRAHGHDRNPNFQNVLLHVVWEETPERAAKDGCPPATLSLKNVLDAPLAELSVALENESLRSLPESLRGKCCAPLRELAEPELFRFLDQAAHVRLENKAAHIRARARDAGREQARLLGVSGLLPEELTRAQKSTDSYVRQTWDAWWRERDAFSDVILPRAAWRFHGLRPANHPSRRLALASHWLADAQLIPKIERWIADEKAGPLINVLQVRRDDFWSWHWTFKSARLSMPQPLIGEARVTDLAVNVILPWLWSRAVEGGNEKIRSEVERRFLAWPPAEDNSILKLARQRLLGASNAKMLKTAAAQQGLIQIVRDFCEHSNATCDDCKFPELVRDRKK